MRMAKWKVEWNKKTKKWDLCKGNEFYDSFKQEIAAVSEAARHNTEDAAYELTKRELVKEMTLLTDRMVKVTGMKRSWVKEWIADLCMDVKWR